ncbi:MAG: RIP metalloprotease RseP [Betaproteobacteria bacterium]|nr:RIP metalloprotease RseP [Betaproteobacteria bacterium]
MPMLSTALAFVLTLGILITFHEMGHYLVARAAGVKVLRFSLGFGPVLWSRRFGKDQTEWSISLLPLGGYVKMLDESETGLVLEDGERAFNRKSVWVKMAIVSAGPLANLLLAVLLYWFMFFHGVPAVKPILAEPPPGSAAAIAGLHEHDEIGRIAGDSVRSWDDVNWVLLRHADKQTLLNVRLTDGRSTQISSAGIRLGNTQQGLPEQLGLLRYDPAIQPIIGEIVPDSIAARAGLRVGDRILALDGKSVTRWQDVVSAVRLHAGKELVVHVERAGRVFDVLLVPGVSNEAGVQVGRIGAGPQISAQMLDDLITTVRYPWPAALWQALTKCGQTIDLNLVMMGQMLTGHVSWHNLSGPLTIADYAGQSARMGMISFVSFLAVISISLGVLNLLPIPLLDGGYLMYYIIEVVSGSPVPQRVVELTQRVGIMVLLTVMFLAFYNDISRLSGS